MVAWNPLVLQVSVVYASPQLVLAQVESLEDHRVFYISVIYGFNNFSARRGLWTDLRSASLLVGTGAWLQLGDYNVVRKMAERMEGFHNDAAVEFNDCLHDLKLEDMPTKGFWYTWTNKRGGLGDNKSKLDRAMVNAMVD